MPPITLKIRNERYFMPLTPAMIGVNVRTMGTNRASTSDFGPCFSKNSCALVTFSCLKRRESGRVKSDGPTFLPNMYPTWSPTMAAMQIRTTAPHSGKSRASEVISMPAVNSSESPGRKKPMSRPDSAKTMRSRPQIPNESSR